MLLADMTWLQVKALKKTTPVIVPIAAMEQHGSHLPLFTDSYLLGEVVRRIEHSNSGGVLILPLQWLGNSHHHRDFSGTISAEPRMYLDLVSGLINNLIADGFQRILVLNGHGGNEVPGQQALFELRQQHRTRTDLLLLFTSYWKLRVGNLDQALGFLQHEMGHACEWETSMMLTLAADIVGDYQAVEPVDPEGCFPSVYRPWVTQDRSELGHIGYPHAASREKGEQLFSEFHRGVIELLQQIQNWNGTTWKEK